MNTAALLLGAGALGLLVLPKSGGGDAVPPAGSAGPSIVPPPRPIENVPPPPPPFPATPPLTIEPNGRHLSADEKSVLRGFIPAEDLDSTVIFWAPPSSFKSEDPGKYTEALTTARGIYMRGPNRPITTIYELATLGHELVHVAQFRKGEVGQRPSSELELEAYQMGLGVEKQLEARRSESYWPWTDQEWRPY